MKLNTKIEQKYCVSCGSTQNLVELECGKFGCIDCLNEIAKEQKQMLKRFTDIMKSYDIVKPETQIKTLLSIVAQIEIENNLASPLLLQEVKETKERMFDNVQNGGTCLTITIGEEDEE